MPLKFLPGVKLRTNIHLFSNSVSGPQAYWTQGRSYRWNTRSGWIFLQSIPKRSTCLQKEMAVNWCLMSACMLKSVNSVCRRAQNMKGDPPRQTGGMDAGGHCLLSLAAGGCWTLQNFISGVKVHEGTGSPVQRDQHPKHSDHVPRTLGVAPTPSPRHR